MSTSAFIWMVMCGAGLLAVGAFGLATSKRESRDARAVRAFFKDYASDHHVSSSVRGDDDEWVIYVRSLTDRQEAYTAIPISLLMRLSKDTEQVTPWTAIVVDPAKMKNVSPEGTP